MSELKLTKEYMDGVIIAHGMIPMDFEVTSCNQQIHYMDKDGYKYNYSWSQFPHRVNIRPIQFISQSNIYSIENIKNYIKINNINSEIISDKFTNVTDWNLQFKCSNCEKPFYCSWNKFKRRKYFLCDDCLHTSVGVYKKPLDKDYVYNEFKKRGLTMFNKDDYKNSQELIHCYDEDGYKYVIKYGNLSQDKFPSKVLSNNPYSIDNIKNFLMINNSKTVCLSSEYVEEKSLLEFKCGQCGEKFSRSWANIRDVLHLTCENCQIKNRGIASRLSMGEVIKGFERMELKLLDFNYEGNGKRLLCEDKFGYRGFVSYNSQKKVDVSSRTGFDYFSLKHNKSNFIYNANNYCKNNGYETQVLSLEDENLYTTPSIKCKCECGEEYITSINSFVSGKAKCDKCSKRISRYEQSIINYLKKHKIKYTRQKKYHDCRNVLPLPFDFYLKDFDILIEVDGQGHYQVCYFNGCSKESGEISLKRTQFNDIIKTNYCKENGIKLIRIPYWEMDDNSYIEKLNQLILNLAD